MTSPAELADFLQALRSSPGGVVVPVHARPGAQREGLLGLHGGALKIATRAPAEDGRATLRIARLLAEVLDVAPSRVTCVTGASSRVKRFQVHDLPVESCRARLAEVLA